MKYRAVIDLGSSELRMTIMGVRPQKGLSVIEEVRRMVAAGEDTYRDGIITADTRRQILDTLAAFRLKLKDYPGATVTVMATSAFREASNCPYFVDQIERETGFQPRVLSNNEELAYKHLSLLAHLDAFPELVKERSLCLDLAAGSIQLSIFDGGVCRSTQNMKLGSLRLQAILSQLAEHSSNYTELLLEYISGDLSYFAKSEPLATHIRQLFISGTEIVYLRRLADLPLTAVATLRGKTLEALFQLLLSADPRRLQQDYGIPEAVLPLLLPTTLIIREFFRFTGLASAILPDASMVEGVFLSEQSKERARLCAAQLRETRLAIARNLAARSQVDPDHSNYVTELALTLFDQLRKLHRLGEKERDFLELAAILHNVGKRLSTVNRPQHSQEMVAGAELPGFSPEDLAFLAALVYSHNGRRRQPPANTPLDEEERLRLDKLAAILALANAMDTTHRQKIPRVRVEDRGQEIRFILYTRQDITLELWGLAHHKELFEQVYGKTLRFVVKEEKEVL